MLTDEQRQKAHEALERKKAQDREKRLSMMYHLSAYFKLHFDKVLLPYRILYNLEKQEHDKTFLEVPPNPFYPAPAMTMKTKWKFPHYSGDYAAIQERNGYPDFRETMKEELEEYNRIVEAEKMDISKWGFYYARFLLPYDLHSFSDFDWLGERPQDEEEKELLKNLKAACIEAQADCKAHPEDYNLEPVPRLESHKQEYDVPYGYI